MALKSYRELVAWQRAMDLAEQVYAATRGWPSEERYGPTSQVRRAAVSVPSNIAEGQGRTTTREFLHQLSIARGSLMEVETQIMLAQRLDYQNGEVSTRILDCAAEVSRLISGLFRALENRES